VAVLKTPDLPMICRMSILITLNDWQVQRERVPSASLIIRQKQRLNAV